MATRKPKRALISVYDKTGIVDFARTLHDEFAIEIISTGGTAKLLTESGIPVTLVEEVTGSPELLDGRVKTLHPKIHAAILADRDNPDHMRQLDEQGIKPIDMVVVNLYPFEKTVAEPDCTFEQAIEMIDIGGVTLLRAAAKNHKHVFVFSMNRYDYVLETLRGDVGADTRDRRFVAAVEAFLETTRYDAAIASWLSSPDIQDDMLPHEFFEFESWGSIRYGENPHQQAELFDDNDDLGATSLATADCRTNCQSGTSYNNYVDADAAFGLCSELTRAGSIWHRRDAGATSLESSSCCVLVKHTNACGAGVGEDPVEAYRRAYHGDPNAAMGGVLACNFSVDVDFASVVMETYSRWGKTAGAGGFFVEVWVAPEFHGDAVELIRNAKPWGRRVRLLDVGELSELANPNERILKSIRGGLLAQTPDVIGLNEGDWKVATKRKPTDAEMDDLRLAWLVCKHTKSNAISICKDGMLIGNGAGQMSRVMSCRIATWLANDNGHADKLPGSVAASDAFFPFRDGPDLLVDAGVTAIIQPGGSKRDQEVIDACNERDVAMILTGTRHFRH